MMRSLSLIFIVALLLGPGPARAQSCSFTFDPLNFGTLTSNAVIPAATTALGTFQAQCNGTSGTTVRVCVDMDGGTAGSESAGLYRLLSDASATSKFRVVVMENQSRAVWGTAGAATYAAPSIDIPLSAGSGAGSIVAYAAIDSSTVPPRAGPHTSQLRVTARYGPSTAISCAQLPASSQINVAMSLTVLPTCSVRADPLNFGAVFSLDSAIPGRSTIYVTCTNGSSYTVTLDAGLNSTSIAGRNMAFEGARLRYDLYADAGQSRLWGDGVGAPGVQGVGSGAEQSLPVYGVIAARQNVPTGNYTDRIIISVNF